MDQSHSNPEVQAIIEKYNMHAHPEGGYYSETYKSTKNVEGENRKLMTVIYFLLPSDQVSKFHRIKSDEFWFFHKGSPITVHTLTEFGHQATKVGNDVLKGEVAQLLVEANTIFGSSVDNENSYAFVSCVVAPGFEFEDFELFNAEALLQEFSGNKELILKLT